MFCMFTGTCFGMLYSSCTVYLKYRGLCCTAVDIKLVLKLLLGVSGRGLCCTAVDIKLVLKLLLGVSGRGLCYTAVDTTVGVKIVIGCIR